VDVTPYPIKAASVFSSLSNPWCPSFIHVAEIICACCLFQQVIYLLSDAYFSGHAKNRGLRSTYIPVQKQKNTKRRKRHLFSAMSRPSSFISMRLKTDTAKSFLPMNTRKIKTIRILAHPQTGFFKSSVLQIKNNPRI